jgi:3-hydroxyacyl-[acyl-carrier-protein] dehydratase
MAEGIEKLLEMLPHGGEFRFVDRVVSLAGGREGVGLYNVRGDEFFLAGHFPGNPMMPGVLLLEAIAQLGGVVAQNDPAVPRLGDVRLTAVRAAKIFGAAVPGDELVIRAAVDGRLGGLVQISGTVDGPHGRLAEGKVTLSGETAAAE